MNDILDIFLIRFLFILLIFGLIFAYKYAHLFLYPSSRDQLFKRFYPSKNPAETILVFSRILGIGLIFSNFIIFLEDGFLLGAFDFSITAFITFCLYLLSLFILESIVLSNFEYVEEITRKKNVPYAMVSASYAIGIPLLFRVSLGNSRFDNEHNIVYIIFLWLFTIVLLGFAVKTYSFASKLNLNKLLGLKSYALGFSYIGFFLAWIIIVASALNRPIDDIKKYGITLVLKIILSLLILPLFKIILKFIFQIKDDLDEKNTEGTTTLPPYGFGIYEGIIMLTSAYLTTLVTSNIEFPPF